MRGITFDRRTGEVIEDPKVKPEIDQEAVDEAARLDGYYLIVTSETDWDDGRILDAYRELWRIEESFKVTKTGGSARAPCSCGRPSTYARTSSPATWPFS